MALPSQVMRKDQTLQKATDDLAKLRWHWTLDKTNAERVSFREYARQVGVHHAAVTSMSNGYAAFLAAQSVDVAVDTGGRAAAVGPGQPQTVSDFVELAKMGSERQDVVKALAKATSTSVHNIATHKRADVKQVLAAARERALDRGTTLDHEVDEQVKWHALAEKTRKADKTGRAANHFMRHVEIEGHVGVAMQRLRKVLDVSQDVKFTDDEREFLTATLGRLRALLNLIDLRITGDTKIDWDAEMAKL